MAWLLSTSRKNCNFIVRCLSLRCHRQSLSSPICGSPNATKEEIFPQTYARRRRYKNRNMCPVNKVREERSNRRNSYGSPYAQMIDKGQQENIHMRLALTCIRINKQTNRQASKYIWLPLLHVLNTGSGMVWILKRNFAFFSLIFFLHCWANKNLNVRWVDEPTDCCLLFKVHPCDWAFGKSGTNQHTYNRILFLSINLVAYRPDA